MGLVVGGEQLNPSANRQFTENRPNVDCLLDVIEHTVERFVIGVTDQRA
jgi:hypothetical protein